jgi:hypothetical protein
VDDHTLRGLGSQLEFHSTTYSSRWTIILRGFGFKLEFHLTTYSSRWTIILRGFGFKLEFQLQKPKLNMTTRMGAIIS